MAIPPQEVSVERALLSWQEPESAYEGTPFADSPLGDAPLRIRQLEIVGFKSFRDRTVLRFPSGVTGIVGPNGCGKSNVVDAIRWVLGEQSAKRLRGEGMEDVIFGGSDRQAPLGMAQVSIVFETDGLPLEQFSVLKESGHPMATAGPADIMVTRRYLRSGESEYLMNGAPCRLRDITELFLGTGVGTKAYGIIEQGRVEQLIGAKPEELRLFIEEAAGTTLYRSRRQVAERKMERTTENLLRVHDILREVERQLGGLRRQARRAEQYRALQAEVERLELALSARQRARLNAELSALVRDRAVTGSRESELAATLERLEGERRVARGREAEVQRRVQDAQAAAFEARAASDECRHELARFEIRADELAVQDAATADDLAAARDERNRATAERTAADSALVRLHASIGNAEATLVDREAELNQVVAARSTAAEVLEEAKVALVDALAAAARARNTRDVVEAARAEERARHERLQVHMQALATRDASAVECSAVAERGVLDLQAQLEQLAGARRERAEDLRRLLEERTSWDAALDGLKEGLARVRSRRDSLRELADSHAGYGEGVRAVLAASSREEALALVAEVLDVPAEYERALAAAVGEQLQAVITRDHEAACGAVQALRRAGAGRAICIPRVPRPPALVSVPPSGRRLVDLVRVRPGYEQVAEALLANVLLVEDLETALTTWRAGNGAWVLVTLAGETVGPTGAVAGGSQRSEETLLAERRELHGLDLEVERREQDLARARGRQGELVADVAQREATLREVDSELARVTVAVVRSEKDVERVRQELHDLKTQADAVKADLEIVGARVAELDEELAGLAVELGAAEASGEALGSDVGAAELRLGEMQQMAVALQDGITEQRIALAEERTRRTALEAMIERLRRSDEEIERRTTILAVRHDADRLALERTRQDMAVARDRLAILGEEMSARAAAVTEAERVVTVARSITEATECTIATAQAELEEVRARVSAFDLQTTERRLAIEHLEQTMRERYGKEIGDASEPASADTPVEEDRLVDLRRRIAGMGDVNVAALGEVAELEERQQFLDSQRADLERALEDLRKTIARLNRTSRSRFRETFERVDTTFREVFPKLFQGGKAYLRLTDQDHVLESGVEIVVQPPGKRVGSLDLLSGGEKALTAVSLIFALFLIRPSPFCFLDEVDAPLDDANIGRFNSMVREMSARSQFILITHNKRTMEVAETLYGITMEEPGVSKVVSVRLPQ